MKMNAFAADKPVVDTESFMTSHSEILSTQLAAFGLVSVQMKHWTLILKADFDFFLGPESQPMPAVIMILRPRDGKYFISVFSKVMGFVCMLLPF